MGGTIKNKVYQDAMSNKYMIKNAKDFAEDANKTISGITSIYMSMYELLTEPDKEVSMKIMFALLISFV